MASLLDLVQARQGLLGVQRPSMAGLLGGSQPTGTLASTIQGYQPQRMPAMSNQAVMDYARNVASTAQQNLQNQMTDLDRALVMDQGGINVGDRQALARLMEQVPGLMGATAYHGSPHSFNKFDMSKAGTGVGAQYEGRGMYFTSSKDLAETYRPTYDERELQNALFMTKGNIQEAINNARKEAQYLIQTQAPKSTLDETMNLWKALERLEEGKQPQKGTLYKVDIPDEFLPRMINSNATLEDQPEIVKNIFADKMPSKFEKLGNFLRKAYKDDKLAGKIVGKESASSQELSDWLNSQGIPGIKYSEEISRTGKPAENFVVFDPTAVKILEKNNQKVEGLLE